MGKDFPVVPDRKKACCGQAIVELALVLPVILAIASLAIDAANMVFIAHRLSAATREGARVATESTLASPQNPTVNDNCDLSTCASSASLCCIAVNRTGLVLFDTGIQDGNVEARWVQETKNNCRYVLLEVEASTHVNFFFGLGNRDLSFSSVAYAGDYDIATGDPC